MREDVRSTETLSVCVDREGNAAVFLCRPDRGLAGIDVRALADVLAAHGLRLCGLSSSPHGVPAGWAARTCRTTLLQGRTLADALLSLIDLRHEVLA